MWFRKAKFVCFGLFWLCSFYEKSFSLVGVEEDDMNTKDRNIGKPAFELYKGKVLEVVPGKMCYRTCENPANPKICEWNFKAEWFHTMTPECKNCPYKIEDCYLPNCIAADGQYRLVQIVNRQLPGPDIQVCHKDIIRVNFLNDLQPGHSITIHFHGIQQRGTPWMDGVPRLTQCYINFRASFKYEFEADPPGTHFWHSHGGFQSGDGLYGSLVVRQAKDLDPHHNLYDEDISDHVMIFQHWRNESEQAFYQKLMYQPVYISPNSMLLNGRGMFQNYNGRFTPVSEFSVQPGKRYRFRTILQGPGDCRVSLWVYKHKLTIIASDIGNVVPYEVDAIIYSPGERFDFIIETNQKVNKYWILVKGQNPLVCDFIEVRALLVYSGATDIDNTKPGNGDGQPIIMNKLNTLDEVDGDARLLTELKSLDTCGEACKEKPDKQLIFFSPMEDEIPKTTIPFGNPTRTRMSFTTYLEPLSPPLTQPETWSWDMACTPEQLQVDQGINCWMDNLCECTHAYKIPLGSTVELVQISYAPKQVGGNHPMHLHGNEYRVVAMDVLESLPLFKSDNQVIEWFNSFDNEGNIVRNLNNPPIKDTASPPSVGYLVIRWHATNPGWWFYHCHLDVHTQWGMSLAFFVGEENDIPDIPTDFPTCGNWSPDDNDGSFDTKATQLKSGCSLEKATNNC